MKHSFDNAAEVQQATFGKLLSKIKKTTFGDKHNLASVKTYAEYKRQVPLHEYDDMKPFIQCVMKGEQNVLWPEEVLWFAKSSGTTSDSSKYLPVSFESLEECHFRGARDLLAWYYYYNPDARIFRGKGLLVGGSCEVNTMYHNSFYGDLSGILMNNLPMVANLLATPKKDIALESDWEVKMELMINSIIMEDVTNISGIPSWTLFVIKSVLKKTGARSLKEVWPNLELYMHGGINFEPYKDLFTELIGDNIEYRETYNASEGFFGIQDRKEKDMMLMLDYGIFYEFIPMTLFESIESDTCRIEDVEVGINYAMVISTSSGLCRYIIGDIVVFTSKNPYRFKITGRTKSYINTFGEELMVHNAEKAIVVAQKKHSCQVSEFTVAPVYPNNQRNGGHQWAIEFDTPPHDLVEFEALLDREVQTTNSDYEAKRKGVLQSLEIVLCKKGTFYKWLKEQQKLGGQHKIPKLCNHRKVIEQILKLNNE